VAHAQPQAIDLHDQYPLAAHGRAFTRQNLGCPKLTADLHLAARV
jgi:hypothetical protein